MRFSFSFFAALAGATAIGAAAMGAHGQGALDPEAANWVETGADYQLIHAVVLLVCEALSVGRVAKWLFAAGIVCFSGSLYLLAATGAHAWSYGTPMGGTTLIVAWLALAVDRYRKT